MAIELRPVCVCEKCRHEWIKQGDSLPLQCPQCHTREWNGIKSRRQKAEIHRDQISEDW